MVFKLFMRAGFYLLIGCLALASKLLFAQSLDRIIIEGNDKTRGSVILQEMSLQVGSMLSPQMIETSRQSIMDLGLFEEVKMVASKEKGQTVLHITVDEKDHDWYILPRLDRNGDGDVGIGVNWRVSNLNGLNQKSKLTILHKKFNDATKDEEVRLSYEFYYPRIVGTQWSTFASLGYLQVGLDETRGDEQGNFDREVVELGLGVGRWFSKAGASKGYSGEVGLLFRQFEHDFISGDAGLFDNASVLNVAASLRFNDVNDYLYSREGRAYGMTLEAAHDGLGSDRSFFHQKLYYRQFFRFENKPHTNLNVQVQLGNGDRSLFGEPIYELSGPYTLRGFARETLEGNAFFLVNAEYLQPILGKQHIRGGFLFDFGNAYNTLSDFKDFEYKFGFGFSLRWLPKKWVDTVLRVDLARGLDDEGSTRLYATANASF